MKIHFYIILIFAILIQRSLLAQKLVPEVEVEFRGIIASNGGNQIDFFEQRRSLLIELSLDAKAKVQIGLSKTRVENAEILKLPLLFRYEISDNASVYGGV